MSDQLYGTPAYHMAVRDRVVDHIRANPQAYAGYCPLPFEEYCRDMRRKETWGDNLTLQASGWRWGVGGSGGGWWTALARGKCSQGVQGV